MTEQRHIAITGGIGSGKSYVCRLLEQRGISVYDCDAAAKRLMHSSAELRKALTDLIGPEAYGAEGPDEALQLNKAVVARFLLASAENAKAIDDIVHPAVAADFISSGQQWLESAILFQSGFDRRVHFDAVICVTAPEEVRIERVMARDGITREKACQWIGRQWPQAEMLRRSDYEIINDGQQHLLPQIDRILKKQKTMQQTILSIAGKPGLYKLVSRGKNNLIVEALDNTHKRMPAFGTDRITSLADIAMFTDTDDVPLMDVLESLKTLEEGKKCSLDAKKASGAELFDYFAKVLPNFDRDRVHGSDIKKLIQWYNILVEAGITDFKEELKPTEGDNIADREEPKEQ